MWERFTDQAREAMNYARSEAQRFNHEYIGMEHILLGLVMAERGFAAHILDVLGASLSDIRSRLGHMLQPGPTVVYLGYPPQAPRAKRVIEYAMDECRNLGVNYVGTEHILFGLLREGEGVAAEVLKTFGLCVEVIQDAVRQIVRLSGHADEQAFEGVNSFRNRIILCRFLVAADHVIDILDRAVFDAAWCEGLENLDAQRDRALSSDFQNPIKDQRNFFMDMRNCAARMIDFQPRRAHDLSPRDYTIWPNGYIIRNNG